eukprot:scaffold847_cov172-Ochromonas_danica.AAC.5
MMNLSAVLFFLYTLMIGSHGWLQSARPIPSRALPLSRLQATVAPSSSSLLERPPLAMAKEPEKTGYDWLKDKLAQAEKDEKDMKKKNQGPPLYEPGPLPQKLLAAAAYLIPIVDASDLGKYMFAAYPEVGTSYNTLFGSLSAIYNGVPFLPFAIFFIMSYIARAPSFPVEVRFHFSQAVMIGLVQFVPSLLFGLLEKVDVPYLPVLYNTGR